MVTQLKCNITMKQHLEVLSKYCLCFIHLQFNDFLFSMTYRVTQKKLHELDRLYLLDSKRNEDKQGVSM